MHKVKYQNHIRRLFLCQQEEKGTKGLDTAESKRNAKKIKLIHQDWACKIPEIRLKFLPDFETLKKPGFGTICECNVTQSTV
jgi:hypothetical protein